ncbi:MAG TPA: hypothetical protein VJT31_05100, partial [Rugosimonospora sp.]|nr:hypothetical protein [Rugosimonospora sp.]
MSPTAGTGFCTRCYAEGRVNLAVDPVAGDACRVHAARPTGQLVLPGLDVSTSQVAPPRAPVHPVRAARPTARPAAAVQATLPLPP